ncbi:MAG: exosortase/archaeosortase family protein [Verrucomicrobia bacterium]|nr:exosortase/archaeosortase family protein [Verrucomicrobiota bacterium]
MNASPPPLRPALRALPFPGWFSLGLLAAATAVLTARLWPHWRTNPDLSHGFFMPVLFFLLLHESRAGSPRYLRKGAGREFGLAALLAGALLTLFAAGLYAAAVDWSHALVNVMLTASLALFTSAAVVVFARDSIRLMSFNWTALAAAGLWLLTTPIPPGTYTRLTLALQLWVSEGVLRTLHLLGIAAVRHGNIIDLATTSVGVEEACSGVRSLISCLFAGVFFSATLVRRPWARALLIGLAAPLALSMNFLRSLALTLLANASIDIGGTWHDATGFAVLGLTAAMLGTLAVWLERGRPVPAASAVSTPPGRGAGAQWLLAGVLTLAAALAGFFVANTRSSDRSTAPDPDLHALLPASSEGWQVRTANLFEFRGTLQTEHLAQRQYLRADAAGRPIEIVIYVAFWHAGRAPVSLVASHTPDACWPGAGWTPRPIGQPRAVLVTPDRTLPVAEYRVFDAGPVPQHVWFWHLHAGRPISYRDPYSATELLRIAWKYGFRRDGDQVFVRVSSNRPWAEIQGEPLLREFFTRLRPLGL